MSHLQFSVAPGSGLTDGLAVLGLFLTVQASLESETLTACHSL